MKKILFIIVGHFITLSLLAQQRDFWTQGSEKSIGKNVFANQRKPSAFQVFKLNEAGLKAAIRSIPSEKKVTTAASSFILSVPDAQGKLERFRVVEASVMQPGLAAKHPDIGSFAGIGIDDPTATLRFAFSPQGFSGTIFSDLHPTVLIERVDKATASYLVASKDAYAGDPFFNCTTTDAIKSSLPKGSLRNADDAKLRTMRLALATDGEFANAFDNDAVSDVDRRANVLTKLNALMTRSNGVFEKDFDLRLLMIDNEDAIIYLDPATDPWGGGGNLNNQTQSAITGPIPNSDYDIGHAVLMQGADAGNAGCIGCVCTDGSKGRGYSGLSSKAKWESDAFVIDYLPHEMGHQLGGNHTFSHAADAAAAQVEPGSGTTIMGYAGITGATDVAAHSTDNFHAYSIMQITDNIKAKGCPVATSTGDNVPNANAGADFTIPASTPFILTGSASDADAGDVLSFTWEQMDAAPSYPWYPSTTATGGPAFRCYAKTSSTSRVFPALTNILDGSNTNQWERLPSVGRRMNFRFTVRDNHPGGGSNRSDDMVVTVDGSTGPFSVTSPNAPTVWCPGVHTVSWNVAGSDGGSVNTANVNILLSTDGGLTFPVTLAANTPNDGSQDVAIGCTYSTTARIKVEAVGNIFFDISDANFTVGDNTPPTFTVPADIVIAKDANCNYSATLAVTGDVTDESDNCIPGLNATYSDVVSPGSCVGETIIKRTWTLADNCFTVRKVQTITIKDVTPPTFTAPPDKIIFADASCGYDASVGITGDVSDEADNCDNTLNATFTDIVTTGSCIGEKIIKRTWSLTDDCNNNTTHIQTITVKDNTPPVISGISANPNFLWSPNHKMRDVVINYTAVDNCSPVTSSLSVASNEPINGTGDGNTSVDWQVVDAHHVQLRAERSGNGNGRIYTITIKSTDDCGNVTTATVTVAVAHDQSLTRLMTTAQPHGLQVLAAPNPARKNFQIYVNSDDNSQKIVLEVIDMLGRIVEKRTVAPDSQTRIGDLYKPGNYLVRVVQGKQQASFKLIKLAD